MRKDGAFSGKDRLSLVSGSSASGRFDLYYNELGREEG